MADRPARDQRERLDLGVDDSDGCQNGVDWLMRLRQLQRDGHDFGAALAIANAEWSGV